MKLSKVELRKRQEKLSTFYGEIKKIVRSVKPPDNDAEDLVQEIFIEAYNHLADIRDMDCFSSWVYKIAYRKLIRFSSKRIRRNTVEELLAPEDWELVDIAVEDDDREFCIANRTLTNEELFEMVNSLKSPVPEIINLHFAKGYTLKEISEMMDMNYNTVKTIVNRALKKLKKKIIERSGCSDEVKEEKELYQSQHRLP